jgi:hypothetical protein
VVVAVAVDEDEEATIPRHVDSRDKAMFLVEDRLEVTTSLGEGAEDEEGASIRKQQKAEHMKSPMSND